MNYFSEDEILRILKCYKKKSNICLLLGIRINVQMQIATAYDEKKSGIPFTVRGRIPRCRRKTKDANFLMSIMIWLLNQDVMACQLLDGLFYANVSSSHNWQISHVYQILLTSKNKLIGYWKCNMMQILNCFLQLIFWAEDSLNFIQLLRVDITLSVTFESTGR